MLLIKNKREIYCHFTLSAAPGISASPSEDNMRYFNVMILGPTQSPYEGNELNFKILLQPVKYA